VNTSTKKWLFMKYSSAILIPFKIWFIINFVTIFQADHSTLVTFFSDEFSRISFSIFLILAFFFFSLTISEIFEDYIANEKIKNVANKILYIFAIIIPLITILFIYNL
tara:strand:+ start:11 stop:334 length:324 start_codon:yes stop_codon:yes gene_type:complete